MINRADEKYFFISPIFMFDELQYLLQFNKKINYSGINLILKTNVRSLFSTA